MELNELVEQRLPRIKNFWQNQKGALINVSGVASFKQAPSIPLSSWNFPADLYPYLDTAIEASQLHWEQRSEIYDDLLPSVYPWFGIAEHSAIVAGEIHFSETTSFQIPYITTWDKLDSIVLSEKNKWFKMLMNGFRYLKEKTAGRFLVRMRGADGPMDMANALRGNDLFTDFYDYPDEVHKLLALCEKAVNWSFENQQKIIDELDGGWLTGYSVWMPGKSAGHISEDASVMCSSRMYREFGRPYTGHFCTGYDNVLIHLHGAGEHVFPDIVSIPQCTCVELTNDPNCLRGMELFRKYETILDNKIVVLHLTRDEFEENREFLKYKKIIMDYTAESVDDARSMIESVRSL